MSQLSALLSEARATADDTSQDEQNFIQVQNKHKRFRNQNERNSMTVRSIVITINPTPPQMQFVRAMNTTENTMDSKIAKLFRFLYPTGK